MVLEVILSSIAAGLIATGVMVLFLYLPRLWSGGHYDVLNAVGSAVTKAVDERAPLIGSLIYFAGGIFFAFLYGWIALVMLRTEQSALLPQLIILPDFPTEINLIFPLVGLGLGFIHGMIIALLVTIVVIEHHPLERFRDNYRLVVSQLIGHVAFGFVVMFFHSQFLPLLGG